MEEEAVDWIDSVQYTKSLSSLRQASWTDGNARTLTSHIQHWVICEDASGKEAGFPLEITLLLTRLTTSYFGSLFRNNTHRWVKGDQ